MKKQYKLITNIDANVVERNMNEYSSYGYQPEGEFHVSVIEVLALQGFRREVKYTQLMVKETE